MTEQIERNYCEFNRECSLLPQLQQIHHEYTSIGEGLMFDENPAVQANAERLLQDAGKAQRGCEKIEKLIPKLGERCVGCLVVEVKPGDFELGLTTE